MGQSGRSLHSTESKQTHLKACDFHRNDSAHFVLGGCIILFAELHDVQSLHTAPVHEETMYEKCLDAT